MRLRNSVCALAVAVVLALGAVHSARAQVNTVNLSGSVLDPQDLAVAGATVTVKNLATGAERTAQTDSSGRYEIVGLPPGHYSVAFESKGFAKVENPDVVLTLGVAAEINQHMTVQAGQQTVEVSAAPELVETTKSAVSETITGTQINNLPINGRNYINFTLLDSQANRDSAPSIGAAPTSGLNFGGQRARSNEVSVDGADAVDNSINGVRSTVSQEAVQEFQLIISNYMPEFGRATGAVVNIVTKSGSNDTHGNIFGFLRHSSLQARNPFSVQVNPTTGQAVGVKQAFTRVQAGATIGGPIQKDKTFYFFSYETTRRQETGFTDIGVDNFGLVQENLPPAIFPLPLLLTAQQKAFVDQQLAAGNFALAGNYAVLAGSGSQFGLTGFDFGAIGASFGVAPCAAPTPAGFPCFPLPAPGKTGALTSVSRPASFVPLTSLIGNYPIKEGPSLWSARLDHLWNQRNTSFVRANVSPSLITGIQVNAQNQNFGQNAGSRTSLDQVRDLAIVGEHTTAIGDNRFNEIRYQFARRGLHYGFSQLPGGSNIAVNIPGFAFFGREPFSTVDRIERRNQWTDNFTWIKGRHTLKFGGDANLIQIRSSKAQVFELNFGGLFNFGGLTASQASAGAIPNCIGPSAATDPACSMAGDTPVPGLSAIQAYGLGLPQVFDQGIGHSSRPLDNKTLGVFAQDSWKMNSRFTLNYGVRYDIEFTPTFKPDLRLAPLNVAAEPAMGVLEGIPVYTKGVQPRLGFAWDPRGTGKTVIRGGYGLFFDHPLLALAFDSTTADGALSSQLTGLGGAPSALPISNPANQAAFNAASLFQGILNPGGIPGISYLGSQQRFDPLNSPFFNNQTFLTAGFPITILPFTLPTARSFVYASAQQGNLTVERELSRDFKIDISYSYTHGVHLNRPRNINNANANLLVANGTKAILAGLVPPGTNPDFIQVPGGAPGSCVGTAGGGSISIIAPNILGAGFSGPCVGGAPSGAPIGTIGTPAIFNFFRPSGPNPSFGGLIDPADPLGVGYATLVALATLGGFPPGKGVPVPWSDVEQQESSGNSVYHGLTVGFTKRFSHHFEIFSNYTWSHAIDDSTDLQTLLDPQNDLLPNKERSSSTFDQRHRWVTNAVFQSPFSKSDDGWWRKFFADFTVAPIFDVSSGRPFTVLTGTDFNLNFSSNTDRPSVVPKGTPGAFSSPFIKGASFTAANVCPGVTPSPFVPSPPVGCDGNLSRNAFTRPGFFTIDLRVSRRFPITERWSLDVIAEGFNMLNRNNVADVNPLCDVTGSGACLAGQPTAALDPRQFQFALKLNW
jgi:hypothetical protein